MMDNARKTLIDDVMNAKLLGSSYGEIANKLGVSRGVVSGIINRNRSDSPIISPRSVPIEVNGTVYTSQSDAARKIGFHVRKSRITNFKNRGWQAIDTAPKDGTSILAFPCTFHTWESSPHDIDVVSWRDGQGWYLSVDDGVYSLATHLTHWMPLPTPPTD